MSNTVETKNVILTHPSGTTSNAGEIPRRRFLSPLLCAIVAATGIFGGFLALFAGLVFVLIAAASGNRSYDQTGTTMLIVAIPAILIGSIFLDEIHETK
jgi:hypothetical protein